MFKRLKLVVLISILIVTFVQCAFAKAFNYSEFSKSILKSEVYDEYKKEADAGDISAIIANVASKPDIPGTKYVELTKRILKPEVYERLEKAAYDAYDKHVKPLPKVTDATGKSVIDIQKVREISYNNDIAAFRQAYIAAIIEFEKNQFHSKSTGSKD